MEAMAQLGGIVMMDPDNKEAQKNFFFGGIEGCKFRRPVVPGDTLVRGTTCSFNVFACSATSIPSCMPGRLGCSQQSFPMMLGIYVGAQMQTSLVAADDACGADQIQQTIWRRKDGCQGICGQCLGL